VAAVREVALAAAGAEGEPPQVAARPQVAPMAAGTQGEAVVAGGQAGQRAAAAPLAEVAQRPLALRRTAAGAQAAGEEVVVEGRWEAVAPPVPLRRPWAAALAAVRGRSRTPRGRRT
jgi:hypothetical protein